MSCAVLTISADICLASPRTRTWRVGILSTALRMSLSSVGSLAILGIAV